MLFTLTEPGGVVVQEIPTAVCSSRTLAFQQEAAEDEANQLIRKLPALRGSQNNIAGQITRVGHHPLSQRAQILRRQSQVQGLETAQDHHLEKVQRGLRRDRQVPLAVPLLPISNNLYALISKLPA